MNESEESDADEMTTQWEKGQKWWSWRRKRNGKCIEKNARPYVLSPHASPAVTNAIGLPQLRSLALFLCLPSVSVCRPKPPPSLSSQGARATSNTAQHLIRNHSRFCLPHLPFIQKRSHAAIQVIGSDTLMPICAFALYFFKSASTTEVSDTVGFS